MHGKTKPRISKISAGTTLVRQGRPGTDVYLLLDHIMPVRSRRANGSPSTDRGALLGERAHLEEGVRTVAGPAVTPCRIAAVDAGQLERAALTELSGGHRREEADA